MEEEYDIQHLTCKKCGHIKVSTANVIKSITTENFRCECCYSEDGVLHNKNTTKCATCTQVWRTNQIFYHIKGCESIKKMSSTTTIDPDNVWRKGKKSMERVKIEGDMSLRETRKIYRKLVAKINNEPIERAVRIEKLLEKISNSLDKKEPEVKVKEVNHHAVQ